MYFFISEIGWMFRPHHHPTDFLLWKRRPRPRSSMLPAGRSARTAPARLSHTRAASVRSRPHRTHEGTPGRSAARLLPAPDSRAAAPPHPYRNRTAASYSHALSFPLSSSQTTTALRHHCCSSPPKRQLPGGWPQYSVASFHITRPMPPSSPHHAPSSNVHVRRASGSLHLP